MPSSHIFSRTEIFDHCLVRREIFHLLQTLFSRYLSHGIFWFDKVEGVSLTCPFSYCQSSFWFLCLQLLSAFESHRTTCRKNSREFGKKGGEDRQKVHFFFFQEAGKCKENRRCSQVCRLLPDTGNISLDGFASPPSCLASSSSFFNISLGTGT